MLSFLCAFFLSLTDLCTKRFSNIVGDVELALGRILFSIPILWIFSFIDGIPDVIDQKLIWVYILGLPLELIAMLLYVRSLRVSPLSLTVPFLSFTPAFLLITSPLILGEIISINGIIGILIIVLGAYSLNLNTIKRGFFYPVRMVLKEKGSIMMLTVAFIYSITSNFGKMGVLYSSPTFFAASYFTLLSIPLSVLALRRNNFKVLFRRELIIIGILSAIMITFHMMAIKLIFVSYMISIKRSSLLFGIIFGGIFLKESGLKVKLFGGFLMILGIMIISFLG